MRTLRTDLPSMGLHHDANGDPVFPLGKPTNRPETPRTDPPIPGRPNWFEGPKGPYYVEPPRPDPTPVPSRPVAICNDVKIDTSPGFLRIKLTPIVDGPLRHTLSVETAGGRYEVEAVVRPNSNLSLSDQILSNVAKRIANEATEKYFSKVAEILARH